MNKRMAVLAAAAILVTLPACSVPITPSHAEIIARDSRQIIATTAAQLQAANPGAALVDTHTVSRALVVFDRSSAETSCNLSPIEEHQLQSQDAQAYGEFWLNSGEHVRVLVYPPSTGGTWMRQILTDDGYTGYTCKNYLAETD